MEAAEPMAADSTPPQGPRKWETPADKTTGGFSQTPRILGVRVPLSKPVRTELFGFSGNNGRPQFPDKFLIKRDIVQ